MVNIKKEAIDATKYMIAFGAVMIVVALVFAISKGCSNDTSTVGGTTTIVTKHIEMQNSIDVKETHLDGAIKHAVGTVMNDLSSSDAIILKVGNTTTEFPCDDTNRAFCSTFHDGDKAPFTYFKDQYDRVQITRLWTPDSVEVLKEFSE